MPAIPLRRNDNRLKRRSRYIEQSFPMYRAECSRCIECLFPKYRMAFLMYRCSTECRARGFENESISSLHRASSFKNGRHSPNGRWGVTITALTYDTSGTLLTLEACGGSSDGSAEPTL